MVRKKSNDHKQQNPSQASLDTAKDSTFTKPANPLSRQSSIDDPKEKLQNLKSLNSLLLKEAFESRHQIESLVQAKVALEAELSEKKTSFELQNETIYVYVETQMKELGSERENVIGDLKKKVNELMGSLENEREILSLARKDFELQVNEGRLMKEKLKEMEGSERKLVEKIGKMEVECDSLVAEKVEKVNELMGSLENEREMLSLVRTDFELQVNEGRLMKEKLKEMEASERKLVEKIRKMEVERDCLVAKKDELEKVKISMVKDKDLLEKNMKVKAEEVEHLRRENEKIEIEIEKHEQRLKIDEMEKEMSGMNEVILSLRMEDVLSKSKILELEKDCGEAMDREAEKAIEIGALVEEKRAKERSIESLMEENAIVSRSLKVVMVESEDKQSRIEKLFEENDAARRVLETKEKELKDMQKKIEELSGDKIELEKVKFHVENENVKLNNEVFELRNIMHRLQEECSDHRKEKNELVSEVSHVKDLVDRVTLEKGNALKELADKRNECQNLINEKKEISGCIELMVEDKDRLQKELLEAKRTLNDSISKMESTHRTLTLLKNTASMLCQSMDDKDRKPTEEEQKLDDEIEPYATELEAIKRVFKNKETMAQDLEQKVKLMEISMVETEKKKSFWTMVSSATTLFAAVSMAYAAKGH